MTLAAMKRFGVLVLVLSGTGLTGVLAGAEAVTEAGGLTLTVSGPTQVVGIPAPRYMVTATITNGSGAAATGVTISSTFPDGDAREEHIQGWRFQLSLFANLIADRAATGAASVVDQWFAAWGEPDATVRERALATIAAAEIQFGDRFSCLDGLADINAHLTAAQRFMPGMRLERRGEIRQCQWHVLADWVAVASDGQERGRGTNLFVLDADGRITAVTGFWVTG